MVIFIIAFLKFKKIQGEKMKKTLVTMVAGMMIFAGCASQKEVMLEQGHSLAYADGFDDGCHSGKKAGGKLFEDFKKDENRFARHSKYTQGWSDGFRECEKEQEAIDREVRMGMEQQQLMEARKNNENMNNYYFEQYPL